MCLPAVRDAQGASDNSAMSIQESVNAFPHLGQSTTTMSQAINALGQSSSPEDEPEELVIDRPMQPNGPQQIVDGPSTVANVFTQLP